MKYCTFCGRKIEENASFCGGCGNSVNSNFKQNQTIPNKKSKAIVKVFAIIIVVIVVLGGTFGFLSMNSAVMEKSAIIHNKGNDYYINGGGNIFLLDDSVLSVKENIEDSETQRVGFISVDNSVYDGRVIYAQRGDQSDNLYKYTFEGEVINESIWVSKEVLENSDVTNSIGHYTRNMHYWNIDGDYVYFICIPSLEYLQNQKDIAYQLGKISVDGSNIEFIGETASAYAVKNGWIYFYDNGYVYDESKSDKYYIDYDRAGIYKMKTDGSSKRLLLNGFEQDDKYDDTYNSIYNILCDKISVIDDHIYFIDYSKNGKSRVCRMKTDGSDIEYVTGSGAYSYTVDTKNKDLYYVTGECGMSQTEIREIYKVFLDNRTEEFIGEYRGSGNPELSHVDDYVYIQSQMFFIVTNRTSTCGMRYNIKSGEMESLIGIAKQDSEMTFNPNTGNYEMQKDEIIEEYYWQVSE